MTLTDQGWRIVLERWDGYHTQRMELTLEEFAKLFTWGTEFVPGPGGGALEGERRVIGVVSHGVDE
jgi:hypothetical protein